MPYWQKYTRIFLPLNLILIMISFLFFYGAKPVISSESRPMAIMGPLITTGSVDETTQQILFDNNVLIGLEIALMLCSTRLYAA